MFYHTETDGEQSRSTRGFCWPVFFGSGIKESESSRHYDHTVSPLSFIARPRENDLVVFIIERGKRQGNTEA